jgi:polysaccharide biosynthesis transport protein
MVQKGLTPQDFLELLLRKKWWFISIFVLGTSVSVAISYALPPVYRSSTLILVERQKVPEAYVQPTVTSTIEDRLDTISQQIMSRTNLEKIIAEFGLYKQTESSILQRIPGLERIIARLGFGKNNNDRNQESTASDPEEMVERMRKDIEVKVMGKDAFTVAFSGVDPKTVMGVTNTLASLFIEQNLKVREQQAEGTTDFLESELADAKKALDQQDKSVREYKERYMGALPQQMEANLRTLDRLQLDQQSVAQALKNAEDRKTFYEQQLAEMNAQGAPDQPDQLEAKLAKMKADLSRLQAEYKDSYPDIIMLKRQISETETRLAKGEQEKPAPEASDQPEGLISQKIQAELLMSNSDISSLKVRQKKVAAAIQDYQKRVEETPANEQKLLSLTRDYEISQKNYQTLLEKKLNAKISENLEKRQQGEQFRILDPANLPETPYKPDRFKIILLGILLSGGASAGSIFMVEYLRPSFKKPEDLSGVIELPVLASIPSMPKSNEVGRGNHKHQGVISMLDPASPLTEQYRILYSRIHQSNKQQSNKVFAVSSAVQDEGKTLTALNLAVVMARDFGKRTLLIEGDCKHPSILTYLGKQYSIDLVDVLSHKKDVHLAMVHFAHDNLWILPVTKYVQNSSGFLSSPAMADLIKMLRERYDYVLVDSPPILPLSDMNMFAEMVDGIILVVRAERTPRDAVLQAIHSLATDKLTGIVLNDVRPPFLRDYRYEYIRK